MVAGPVMIYKHNESIKQVSYPWTVNPMPNQGTQSEKPKKFFYYMKKLQHSSWTRIGKRQNLPNLGFRQGQTFQRILATTHQWMEIQDLETLPLCNENIGRILLRTWSQY
ncbi:MAG: hypothetical protein EZS28_054503 [Streblomastix strix]|uniref:Uncharacterized protein n=1 Tax=Streblomastix strix TaxID=222440 RepID=A0A5J4QK93_9EUKA|nr:MAG: hypothetical protein EZS28_054503 [Streblomastix strix]